MCCGQKRAQLTRSQIPSPGTLPKFSRSTPANFGARATSTPAALTKAPNSAHPSADAPATSLQHSNIPAAADGSSVHLQYKEQSPIQVRGLATGRVYQFSGSQPVQAVDQRDAPPLLQTRFFRRA